MKINDKLTQNLRENISDITGKVLWTNSDPTISISRDTDITLSSSDYDILKVYYRLANNNNRLNVAETIKGYDFMLNAIGAKGIGLRRFITRKSDTSYTINTYAGGSMEGDTSMYLIPIYIVGYKTELFS